jgi:hypothetical protein
VERKKTSTPSETSSVGSGGVSGGVSGRAPYEPPQIVYREPLEAIATSCVPAPPSKGSPGACPIGPVSS